jgi:hypothetical protein
VIEYFENMLTVSVRTVNRLRKGHIISAGVNGITLKRVLWDSLAKFCVPLGGVRSKAFLYEPGQALKAPGG